MELGNGMEVAWKWHGSFPEPATIANDIKCVDPQT